MHPGALRPYERSLAEREPLHLCSEGGRTVALDVARWLAPADAVDRDALKRAVSPVLDVGCGPGRILAAAADQGLLGLGIDIAPTAVRMTRERGLNCLQRSVFARLPRERTWATVLLLDGNIGIGGDPLRLLTRAHELLAPSGRVIVEADADHTADERGHVRFVTRGEPDGPAFPWAYTGLAAVVRHAANAGLDVAETWTRGGRTFAVLATSAEVA
jgi:SAM-dependent methyltransferase